MGLLGDNTPLMNILIVAAAAGVGTGAWFLLWHIAGLLHTKFGKRWWDDIDSF
jgi:hypothetical protein